MRILVFFDLPTITNTDRKEYTRFRKYLLTNGFMMLQESVYCKLVLNQTVGNAVTKNIRRNSPKAGLVQMLCITEKQYAKMEFVIGEANDSIINNDERLIML